MSDQSFSTTFTVDRPPREVFDAINDVRSWWNEDITGDSVAVGDEFVHEVKDIHRARIQVTDLVPGRRVTWHVVDNWFGFTDDPREWKDTEIHFDLDERDGATEIRFTHDGLVPEYECFDVCETAWSHYLHGSLQRRITRGAGRPNSSPGERNQEPVATV